MDWYIVHREDSLIQRNRKKIEDEWNEKQMKWEEEKKIINSELLDLQEKKTKIDKQALQKQVLVTSLSAELESKTKGIQNLEQEIGILTKTKQDLQEEIWSNQQTLDSTEKKVLNLQQKVENLQQDTTRFTRESITNPEGSSIPDSVHNELLSLNLQKKNLEEQTNNLKDQIQRLENQISQQNLLLEQEKSQIYEITAQKAQLDKDITQLQQAKQTLQDNLPSFNPKHSLSQHWEPYFTDKHAQTTVHVIPHSHWDREWYLSFENFRYRLVNLMDEVLDFMETNPKYNHFHMDGQMAPVDDYLDIRPYRASEIGVRNQQGRFSLGPWYVQPDEFLVSAESMVRNLGLGIRRASEIGGNPLLLGYLPDSFGHISQLPQIFRGFEIDTSCIARGVTPNDGSHFEQFWTGPDGSQVFVIYISNWYCNGIDETDAQGPDNIAHGNTVSAFLRKITETKSNSKSQNILLMNGCDHTTPSSNIDQWIKQLNEDSKLSSYKIIHSNFTYYLNAVKNDLNVKSIRGDTSRFQQKENEEWMGEMMSSSTQLNHVSGELKFNVESLSNILSTKIRQKQSNWRVQSLLERWVEPISAVMWKITHNNGQPIDNEMHINRFRYDHDRIWYSWKTLLQNHPHDSIGGCSVTDVHEEVDMRFAKSEKVGKQIATDAVSVLSHHASIDNMPQQNDYLKLIVVNPTNFERKNEIVVGYLDIQRLNGPSDVVGNLTFIDGQTGEKVDGLWISSEQHWDYMLPRVGFRQPYTIERVIVAFPATTPPLGYSTYTLSPTYSPMSNSHISKGSEPIESDVLRLSLEGTHFKLFDKQSQTEVPFLFYLEDSSDNGDEYATRPGASYSPTSINQKHSINTPVMSRMDIEFTLSGISMHASLFLWKGTKRVDIRVTFQNTKYNHRTRIVFDLGGLSPDLIEAESQFDVLDRRNSKYNGQQSFINAYNTRNKKGVVLSNRGIPEYQVQGFKVYITLLRATSQVGDWGKFPTSPSSQEIGDHEFELSYILYDSDKSENVHQLGRQFTYSSQIVQSWNYPGFQSHKDLIDLKRSDLSLASSLIKNARPINSRSADKWMYPVTAKTDLRLPSRTSFFNVTPNFLEVSSLKKSETRNSLLLRFWNPTSNQVNANVKFLKMFGFNQVWKCLLNEKRVYLVQDNLSTLDEFTMLVKPKSVTTLEFI